MKQVILFIILSLMAFSGRSSHIVGGEVTYICLGNNVYEFTINIYRDCLPPSQGGGNPAALLSDDPAYISIYNNNLYYSFDSLYASNSFQIPVNFANDCINNIPNTCINRLQFKLIKYLAPSSTPYQVVYQRCCRNETINNISNPGTTGATYMCTVPPGTCNNSAAYINYPPQIICVNNPFVYDHSAIDPDADSLSYEFCESLKGADPNDPKPLNIGGFIPPIASVNYRSPFSSVIPMGGNPILQIDPQTGVITGTPNIQGRFVVAVCCKEWRAGQVINTVTREFQFVVTNCSKAVVANIPKFSEEPNTYIINCKDKTVNFVNQSTGGFKYFWDFGVEGINTDTSDLFQPTYTYPDSGTYLVKLVVNRGTTCPDSITRIVKIYPTFNAAFDYKGNLCPNEPINFTDKSVSSYAPVSFWSWTFGDNSGAQIQNPTHVYTNPDPNDYVVTLIAGNSFGCRDTSSQVLKIPGVRVFAGNDTVIVKENTIQLNGTGALTYSWSPPDFLSDASIANPTAYYADTGRHTYVLQGITENGCVGYDTINIIVAMGPYVTLPNAFTPNSDGNNDIFRILAAGYKKLNSFKIYNRWGELVFATTSFNKGWDGRSGGRDCEIGVYFWILNATDLNGTSRTVKGDVTLLR
ncbi:MAG: gliding motility-associated C-terminal domain-containing protein [Chitinophagaceae bacterium]|nr:gliding motility-associated C-terminal domain-containing protein [Chitinophagaceae bacterium]